jgi:RNA polymerase sigma-70 factor (ECF subfamily)
LPTRANAQPAWGVYLGDVADSTARGTGVVVVHLDGGRIAGVTRFHDPTLPARFGLPAAVPC